MGDVREATLLVLTLGTDLTEYQGQRRKQVNTNEGKYLMGVPKNNVLQVQSLRWSYIIKI